MCLYTFNTSVNYVFLELTALVIHSLRPLSFILVIPKLLIGTDDYVI